MTALSYTSGTAIKTRLGLNDSVDDTVLASYATAVNEWIETYTERQIGPTTGGTAVFDGAIDASEDGRYLYVPQGVRTITSLTVAPSTGATPVSATASDLVILPRSHNRPPDWPGFEVRIVDIPTGSVTYFASGFGNITLVGDFGWASIPAKPAEVATTIGVRLWHGRQTGQADVVGSDETGAPIVSRFVSIEDRNYLRQFQRHRLAAA
jgi:hypothetical protein